jgi:hypothetical protein
MFSRCHLAITEHSREPVMPDPPPAPRKDRPRLEATLVVRMSATQHDLSSMQARAERLTLSDWIRKALQAAIPPTRDH